MDIGPEEVKAAPGFRYLGERERSFYDERGQRGFYWVAVHRDFTTPGKKHRPYLVMLTWSRGASLRESIEQVMADMWEELGRPADSDLRFIEYGPRSRELGPEFFELTFIRKGDWFEIDQWSRFWPNDFHIVSMGKLLAYHLDRQRKR